MNPKIDWLELGPTPSAERCAGIGDDDYDNQSRIECVAFANQLKRLFPEARYRVRSFNHDFGMYREVCVALETLHNDNGEVIEPIAYKVEANIPEFWDKEAKKELVQNGYRYL